MSELENSKTKLTGFVLWDACVKHKECPPFQIPHTVEEFAEYVALLTNGCHMSTKIPIETICEMINRKLDIIKKHYE